MENFTERLKVTGKGVENTKAYLTVSYKDTEYRIPMLAYQQKNKWHPDYVDCTIKTLGSGNYKITQDMRDVLKEIYTVGETYPFKVTTVNTCTCHVIDANGLKFKIKHCDNKKLEKYMRVMCQVTCIDDDRLKLKLVETPLEETEQRPFLHLQAVASGMGLSDDDKELLENTIFSHPAFSEAKLQHDAHDNEWLLSAIKAFDSCLASEIATGRFLSVFKSLSLYLIEGCDIKNTDLPSEQRGEWMEMLTTATQHAEDYELAYKLMDDKEADDYVKQQLQHLKESENLYQPDRKLRTILTIFLADDSLMATKMDEIFDIILQGELNHWKTEPFRSAFVNMLEIFITKYKDKTPQVGLTKIIQALAIQLKLSSDTDPVERSLNKSLFYRFISYVKKDYSIMLLDKSFECLLTPYADEQEYNWEDIADVEHLYTVVTANVQVHALNNVCQVYRDNLTELLIEGNNVTIKPIAVSRQSAHQVVPKNQLKWNNLQILVGEKPDAKLKGLRTIAAYKSYWDAAENRLFASKSVVQRRTTKCDAQVGQYTAVWVESSNEEHSSFLCHIEDDELQGSGWLDLKSIVNYLQPSANILNCFTSPNGDPYLLPVKVVDDRDSKGMYHFSMIDDIREFYANDYEIGKDEFICSIQDETEKLYIGVASNGFSIRIPKDGTTILTKGDVVVGRLIARDPRGQFECEFVKRSTETVNPISAFRTLLERVSLKSEEEEEPDDNATEEVMDKTTVREIASILDRMSALMPERHETYNYLAVSGLLSRMTADHKQLDRNRSRRTILQLFEEYEKNGQVDEEKLLLEKDKNGDALVDTDGYISDHLTLLTILKSISDKSSIDDLYSIYRRTDGSVRKACSAAIALRMLSDFNLPEAKKQIFDSLNAEAGAKLKPQDRKDYGHETQTVEFKSSIIFPAGNGMKPYPRLQEIELLRVICSFLNSDEGGTLYIGVNDYGVACGLNDDFKYLGSHDLEKYGKRIHNRIYDNLGALAADCCKHSAWEKADGYDVFRLTIEPCEDFVAYNGKHYVRFNTEKRLVEGDDLEKLRKRHAEAYAKWKKQHEAYMAQAEAEATASATTATATETQQPAEPTLPTLHEIATSAWRQNIVLPHDENCGKGTCAFVHFCPGNTFKVTDEGIYDTVQLSLAINDDEADGYLVVVYESGKILLTDMDDVLTLKRKKTYNRCDTEVAKFVCPARKGDGVLTLWRSKKNEVSLRIDDLPVLAENHHKGRLSAPGNMLNEYLSDDGLLWAEIIKEEDLQSQALQRFRNHGKNAGYSVTRMLAKAKEVLRDKYNLNVDDF